ncbi:oxygen-independent coproporphyrinogen III oxidase [Rhizobium esperanzae]|uniref:Coproporphyrinogen-III oxidase n=1 Tax=Rhizobium esperanzae TaxID=1967781 RepID=A0A246DKJ9_9HYPH|nr:oxygen-independent coproporphyrinogen III oxidase [Rhizobium esperanzae]OWO89475.1 oxygen-independent coproporphyrinogen III oxidase [Rhizobium esperanzae]
MRAPSSIFVPNTNSGAQLPWYTIYPTIQEFSPEIGAHTYEQWLRSQGTDDAVSLYLHIPFCRSMCWYCGFPTSITRRDTLITDYLAMLREEIRLVAEQVPQALSVGDVHFGGGSPTIMPSADFLSLMELLRGRFALERGATIAIEVDPRTFTTDMAEALEREGVNRASVGVQSFDPVVQKAINRIQSEAQVMTAVENLRLYGVRRINFDLMFGLPNQTVQSCLESAMLAIAMRPDRLAVFGYSHVPSFRKNQRLIDTAALPDIAARAEQASAMADTLVAAGYLQIGLDHFALPDDELAIAQRAGRLRRNSLGYSAETCPTVIGLGASAIGRCGDGYVQNDLTQTCYNRHIASGRLATSRGYRLTTEDRVRAAIIEQLMCYLEADISAICTAQGFDQTHLVSSAKQLEILAEDGIVEFDNGLVRVRYECRSALRHVAAAFDAYLGRQPSRLANGGP